MDIAMEPDDLKTTWQALNARLAQQNRLQLELLREQRVNRARRNLRPLHIGMALQFLLGIGLQYEWQQFIFGLLILPMVALYGRSPHIRSTV